MIALSHHTLTDRATTLALVRLMTIVCEGRAWSVRSTITSIASQSIGSPALPHRITIAVVRECILLVLMTRAVVSRASSAGTAAQGSWQDPPEERCP